MTRIDIYNLGELKSYLSSINTSDFNLINYVWIEYGFYPIIFNELFLPFYRETKGPKMGICFPGHEIFYEPYVDVLIVLNNFIDTSKTYKDNKETELLLHNFRNNHDRGVAFWFTIRNFDENQYRELLNSFKFRNIIFPIGDTKPWDNNLFSLPPGFHYGSGLDGNWYFNSNLWNSTGRLGWNLTTWNRHFEKINIDFTGKYNTFFIKNTWKNRSYHSKDINDIIVGDSGQSGNKSWSYIDHDFYLKVVNFHIDNDMQLVIINDLVQFPKIEHKNIKYLDMKCFFDVKLFVNVINNSENFISICTSPMDIATYYCDTNLVYLNDPINVSIFAEEVQKIKNKKLLSYNISVNDINTLYDFIKF